MIWNIFLAFSHLAPSVTKSFGDEFLFDTGPSVFHDSVSGKIKVIYESYLMGDFKMPFNVTINTFFIFICKFMT